MSTNQQNAQMDVRKAYRLHAEYQQHMFETYRLQRRGFSSMANEEKVRG